MKETLIFLFVGEGIAPRGGGGVSPIARETRRPIQF